MKYIILGLALGMLLGTVSAQIVMDPKTQSIDSGYEGKPGYSCRARQVDALQMSVLSENAPYQVWYQNAAESYGKLAAMGEICA